MGQCTATPPATNDASCSIPCLCFYPVQIFRQTGADRQRDDLRQLIWMLPAQRLLQLRVGIPRGLDQQRCLAGVFDLVLPAIDGSALGQHVHAGGNALCDQRLGNTFRRGAIRQIGNDQQYLVHRPPARAQRTPSCSNSSHTSPWRKPFTSLSIWAAWRKARSAKVGVKRRTARSTSFCRMPHTRASRNAPARLPLCCMALETLANVRMSSAIAHRISTVAVPSARKPSRIRT